MSAHSPTRPIILAASERYQAAWQALLSEQPGYRRRTAPNATPTNQGWRHDLANGLYHLMAWLARRDRSSENGRPIAIIGLSKC